MVLTDLTPSNVEVKLVDKPQSLCQWIVSDYVTPSYRMCLGAEVLNVEGVERHQQLLRKIHPSTLDQVILDQ